MTILGVTFDSTLSFVQHIKNIARVASMKLSHLRRIANLLTPESIIMLYKSQIRSTMEYATLSWTGAARTHLAVLDKIQERARRLATSLQNEENVRTTLDSLQHRRDVGGLTVFFKSNIMKCNHLKPLQLPTLSPVYPTRSVEAAQGAAVVIPRPSTAQYQRAYLYRYSVMWNNMCSSFCIPDCQNVNVFKCKVNAHLR